MLSNNKPKHTREPLTCNNNNRVRLIDADDVSNKIVISQSNVVIQSPGRRAPRCEHDNLRNRCRDCKLAGTGGGSICEHFNRKDKCLKCRSNKNSWCSIL